MIFVSHSLCPLLIEKDRNKLAKKCRRDQSNCSLFVNTNLVINHTVAWDYCFESKMLLLLWGTRINSAEIWPWHSCCNHKSSHGHFKDDANKIWNTRAIFFSPVVTWGNDLILLGLWSKFKYSLQNTIFCYGDMHYKQTLNYWFDPELEWLSGDIIFPWLSVLYVLCFLPLPQSIPVNGLVWMRACAWYME